MEVEDEVQLADVPKVLVQNLYETLHHFEHNQLVLVLIHDGDKVERSKAFIYDLVLLVIEEVAGLGVSGNDQLVDLTKSVPTSFRMRCFSDCDRFSEYHLVNLDLPCLLIKKKQ